MIEELKAKGWYLSNEGLDMCKDGLERVNLSSVIQKALDTDLREISEPYLSDDIYKNKADSSITGPCVLQIQKLKNVSVPKYDAGSNSPLLLRLLLTDGHVNLSCLQWGYWKSINLDTPPGTKIFIRPVKVQMQNGLLLLKESHFSVLGGQVLAMVEKWELTKRLATYGRGERSEDGPPPWIPFGNSINYKDLKASSGNFKSLEQEAKEQKENAVFKQQRMATIAEVSKAKEGKIKVFGGGKDKQTNSKSENSTWDTNARTSNQQCYTPLSNSLNYTKPETYHRNSDNQNFTQPQRRNDNNFRIYKTDREPNRVNQAPKYEGFRNYDTDPNKPHQGQRYEGYRNYETDSNRNQGQKYDSSRNYDMDPNRSNQGQKYEGFRNYDRDPNSNQGQKYEGYKNFNTDPNRPNQGHKYEGFRNYEADKTKRTDIKPNRYEDLKKQPYSNSQRTDFGGSCKTNARNLPYVKNEPGFGPSKGYDNRNHQQDLNEMMAQVKIRSQGRQDGPQNIPPQNRQYLKPQADVLARYWEDKKFYHAVVHAVGDNGTCVVYFVEYGNYEEVRISDVRPISANWNTPQDMNACNMPNNPQNPDSHQNNFMGILEFRRGGNKPYVHHSGNNDNNIERQRERAQRQDHRPAAKLYQPPQQRQSQ